MWARREPFWNISYARLPLEITLGNARPSTSYLLSGAGDSASAASQSSEGGSNSSSATNTTRITDTTQDSLMPFIPAEQRFEPHETLVPDPLSLSSSSRKMLSLVSRCWSSDLRKRPQFEEIHDSLRTIAKSALELEIDVI